MSAIECGEQAKTEFCFATNYTNLNHGSFGAAPDCVRTLQRSYQDEAEKRPDLFIRYTYPDLLAENRKAMADYLDSPKTDIVFVPNATVGINTVLRSLIFKPGDVCLYFSTIYGAMEKVLLYLTEISPLELHKVNLAYPISDGAIIAAFDDAISTLRNAGVTPRLAVFDPISSVPGVRLPFEELTRICRSNSILSLVDGAQVAGQIHVSLRQLDPDFFVTNLHKWLFVPRACAVLYVASRNQYLIRSSLPTSHGYVPQGVGNVNNPLPTSEVLSEFQGNFQFVGTMDNSAYLCVEEALRWRQRIRHGCWEGEDAIIHWLSESADKAGQLVSERLGTIVMPTDGHARCAFSNVELPLKYEQVFGDHETVDFARALQLARWLEKQLVDRFDTFMLVFWYGGKYWTRLSAQIYLTMEDWERACSWLSEVCKDAVMNYR